MKKSSLINTKVSIVCCLFLFALRGNFGYFKGLSHGASVLHWRLFSCFGYYPAYFVFQENFAIGKKVIEPNGQVSLRPPSTLPPLLPSPPPYLPPYLLTFPSSNPPYLPWPLPISLPPHLQDEYCSLPHRRVHEINRMYLASRIHGLFIT
jgi:hypothetical protein